MAVDGQGIVRSILPTTHRPPAAIPQVHPDTRPPGHGHVRGPRLPSRIPRVLLLLRPIARPHARFCVPYWGKGPGGLRTAGLRLHVSHGDFWKRTGGASDARECLGAGGQ